MEVLQVGGYVPDGFLDDWVGPVGTDPEHLKFQIFDQGLPSLEGDLGITRDALIIFGEDVPPSLDFFHYSNYPPMGEMTMYSPLHA